MPEVEDSDVAFGAEEAKPTKKFAGPKKALQKIPGFTQKVRINAAVRMHKMGRPICPFSKQPGSIDPITQKFEPKDMGPDYVNCQKEGGEWVKECEKRGHDPYFTSRTWYEKVDDFQPDGEGNEVLVGTKTVRHTSKYPNIAQVANTLRINSGLGVRRAKELKGFVDLPSLGFEEVCQFRNCQRPVSDKARSRIFGNYCSIGHLRLIAANEQSIFLHLAGTGVDRGIENKVVQLREKQLREAAADAVD